MSKAREERLAEARIWYQAQKFTKGSHVVRAYRKHFKVNRACTIRELCMLHVLPPERQAAYEQELKSRKTKALKRKERKKAKKARKANKWGAPTLDNEFGQDEYFYFIAGYTDGGAPYGITWEEARRDHLIDDEEDMEGISFAGDGDPDWDDLPF